MFNLYQVFIRPFAGLEYQILSRGAYREKNVTSSALKVDRMTMDALSFDSGIHIWYVHCMSNWKITPELFFGATVRCIGSEVELRARAIRNLSEIITQLQRNIPAAFYRVGGSLHTVWKERADLSLTYQSGFNELLSSYQEAFIEIGMKF